MDDFSSWRVFLPISSPIPQPKILSRFTTHLIPILLFLSFDLIGAVWGFYTYINLEANYWCPMTNMVLFMYFPDLIDEHPVVINILCLACVLVMKLFGGIYSLVFLWWCGSLEFSKTASTVLLTLYCTDLPFPVWGGFNI